MNDRAKASWVINAVAPIRLCDLGGWTDTWFADTGAVTNISVYPYVEVQIFVYEQDHGQGGRIVIDAENFGDRYVVDPNGGGYQRHPMLEACIDIMELPDNLSFEVNLYSDAPAGCSTGTSAAASVALIGGLDMLTPGHRAPHELAMLAHRVETEKLGLQCGIQDQLASAYGGICFIEMFKYPLASVSQITLPNSIWWELERRIVLVFLGNAHSSSSVHKQVISRLEAHDSDKSTLEKLRKAARDGKDALFDGDFEEFGKSMVANTDAQAELHPELVSDDARAIIDLARQHDAIGWKVNGAGGDGGSVTILCGPDNSLKRRFISELPKVKPQYQVVPTYLSRMGVRRWMTRCCS